MRVQLLVFLMNHHPKRQQILNESGHLQNQQNARTQQN